MSVHHVRPFIHSSDPTSIRLPIRRSILQSIHASPCTSIRLYICQSIHQSVRSSTNPPILSSIHYTIQPAAQQLNYQFIYPSSHLSYPSNHPSLYPLKHPSISSYSANGVLLSLVDRSNVTTRRNNLRVNHYQFKTNANTSARKKPFVFNGNRCRKCSG